MKRVLIVEDNEMSRDVLARRLGSRGFDVSVAADGLEGLRIAHTEVPDMILMDLGLPQIDGWECVRRLRAETTTRSIPIIALTAHATDGDRQAALVAGCNEFDTKPIDFAGLLTKIARLLDAGR